MKITGFIERPGLASSPSGPAGGDTSGSYPDPTVTGIQGNPICETTPALLDVLTWNGSEWCPAPGSGGGSSLWFNVRAYGAVGDGATDDTAAFNAAIAALVSAGAGVLYIPATTSYYKTTGGLTAISVPCVVMGDGGGQGIGTGAVSVVGCASTTANLFTVSSHGVEFRNLAMGCTLSNPTAGSGIALTTGAGNFARYEGLTIANFWINASLIYGGEWGMTLCRIIGPRKYGLRIANIDIPDGGDWKMDNCWFGTDSGYNADAAIRIESAGGGLITNLKINSEPGNTHQYVRGIDVLVSAGTVTADFLVDNASLENISGDAIHVANTATSTWKSWIFRGIEFASIGGTPISMVAANTSDFKYIVITSNVFDAVGSGSSNAISLTKCESVIIGPSISNFTNTFAQSGCVDVNDFTGGVAGKIAISGSPSAGYVPTYVSGTSATWQAPTGPTFATPAVVLGTAAAAGAASTVIRSDSTIVAFDTTAPEDIPGPGVASATGSVAKAARRDHKHALTYHDEPLTDGASNFVFASGDIVVVTGVAN